MKEYKKVERDMNKLNKQLSLNKITSNSNSKASSKDMKKQSSLTKKEV
jgi:hypothetical protein